MGWKNDINEPRGNRIPFMMSDAELEAVDDFRFKNRMESRSEAVRMLIRMALANERSLEQPRNPVDNLQRDYSPLHEATGEGIAK